MHKFTFTYYDIGENKYMTQPIIRTCDIQADVAPQAIDVFEANVGSINHKLKLIDIREFDEKGKQIGEPITLQNTYINKEKIGQK